MKSYVSKDDILEKANSVPRIIQVPSVVVGYIADWCQQVAKMKSTRMNSTSLNVTSSVKPN